MTSEKIQKAKDVNEPLQEYACPICKGKIFCRLSQYKEGMKCEDCDGITEIYDNICAYRHKVNQNPNYVVFCEALNRLVMRINCATCKIRSETKKVMKKLMEF